MSSPGKFEVFLLHPSLLEILMCSRNLIKSRSWKKRTDILAKQLASCEAVGQRINLKSASHQIEHLLQSKLSIRFLDLVKDLYTELLWKAGSLFDDFTAPIVKTPKPVTKNRKIKFSENIARDTEAEGGHRKERKEIGKKEKKQEKKKRNRKERK